MKDRPLTEFDKTVLEQMEHIRAVGRKRLLNQNDLDDFVQETVARVYAYRSQLRDPSKVKRWIAGVARNTANEWNRALGRRREQPLLDENCLLDPRNPHDALERTERNAQIREALNRLSAADRDLLRERYVEEASYEELQERHGLSYSAVGIRLHRAKQRLKKILNRMKIALVLPFVNLKRYAYGGILAMTKTTKIVLATAAILILALFGGYLWMEYGGGSSSDSAPGLTLEEQTPPVNAGGSTDANGGAQAEASDGAGAAQPIQTRQNGGNGEENLSADSPANSADDAFSIALKEAVQEHQAYWQSIETQEPQINALADMMLGTVEGLVEMDAQMREQGRSVNERRLQLLKKYSSKNSRLFIDALASPTLENLPVEDMSKITEEMSRITESAGSEPTKLSKLLMDGMTQEQLMTVLMDDPELKASMEEMRKQMRENISNPFTGANIEITPKRPPMRR